MDSMMRRVLMFVMVVTAAVCLTGCGGKNSDRQTGTTDSRILGQWVAQQIVYSGQTQTCPGTIDANSSTVSCTNDVTGFTSDGKYSVGATTDDFFFDGTTLILYNRSGNAASFTVVFDASTNVMTWTFSQNGQDAVLTINRQP